MPESLGGDTKEGSWANKDQVFTTWSWLGSSVALVQRPAVTSELPRWRGAPLSGQHPQGQSTGTHYRGPGEMCSALFPSPGVTMHVTVNKKLSACLRSLKGHVV